MLGGHVADQHLGIGGRYWNEADLLEVHKFDHLAKGYRGYENIKGGAYS